MKTGLATRLIATSAGMAMTGYIGRIGPAVGTHDQLAVRSIAFDDGRAKLVLAQCDLLGLGADSVREIRSRAAARVSLPLSAIVLICSHTHSGPPSIHLENCGRIDERWMAEFMETAVECICASVEAMRPSVLRFSSGTCRAAFNRVAGRSDDEDSRLDAQVIVLEIVAKDAPPALVVNYACHPVSLAEGSVVFSRDFPYFAEAHLRETLGPDLELVFAPGACGDLDPISRGGLAEADANGKLLAESILEARAEVTAAEQDEPGALSLKTIHVRIPLERAYTDSQLRSLAAESEAAKMRQITEPAGAEQDVWRKVYDARAGYARHMLAASLSGTLPTTLDAEIAVIRIGALVIVTLPFELFNEVGSLIKAHYGASNTMVVCYTNGDFGYFLSDRLYDKAVYEAKEAFLYYGWPGPIARSATKILLDAILT